MRSFKMFGALLAIVALGVVGVANASAAEFTSTSGGSLSASSTATQVFTTNGGEVKCSTINATGTAVNGGATQQHATVHYSGCTAFGFAEVHISPATYLFTASGTVHLENTITIEVTVPFLPDCTVTVTPTQTLGTVTYSNNSGKLKLHPTVTGIAYHSTGGACGSGGTNGTYVGDSDVAVSGGSLSIDTP